MIGPSQRPARWLALAFLGLFLDEVPAEPLPDRLQVAVASNFRPAMEVLAREFEDRTGRRLSTSYGSTGGHYAQIINGAPFEVFLAADVERPRRLEAEGFGIPGSRFTYAIGKLVLWSPHDCFPDGAQALAEGDFRFLAVANPRTAPYGAAAEQALRRLGAWNELQDRIVRAENIAQAFGYVKSGNADLGLVAFSQLVSLGAPEEGTTWRVPQHLYDPIEQQAIRLTDTEAARAFVEFLRSERAAAVIRARGYELP